jgi:hypothetical protein
MTKVIEKPFPLPKHFLWEYDYDSFDFDRSYKIVIERVLQRGDITDWKNILKYYGREKILEVNDWSRQLDDRDKNFTRIFINSEMLKENVSSS